MYSFLIVIMLYSLLLVKSRNLLLANHYAASLTLSIWLFLSYATYETWSVYILLLIVSAGSIYAITYYVAVKKSIVKSMSEYAIESYKGEDRKQELALFSLYFLVLSPLIEHLDHESIYVTLIPFVYLGIERTLFTYCMGNNNNSR